MKILIVGHGFVGKAVDYGFTHPQVEKTIIDPKYGTSVDQINPVEYECAFVCVPTPMSSTGAIDSSIIDNVVNNLRQCPLVIVKSTVTPDIVSKWPDNVVYNPEFLTEKSAAEQFVNPQFHIFGGPRALTKRTQWLYENYSLCNIVHCLHMSVEEASFVKYTINSFLALKVIFFNQLYEAINQTDANFATVIKAVGMDSRIGPSHTKVPGFDGKLGFGGACFPKDTAAFINYNNCLTLLQEAVTINNKYRAQYELDDREKEQNITYGDSQ